MAWDIDIRRPRFVRPSSPFGDWEDMERLLDMPFARWPLRSTWRRLPEDVSWAPPLEMYEKEGSFTVRVEAPGVKIDDIDISVTGDTLTIKGERKAPGGVKDEEYECCEVCYGKFARSVVLPAAVDANKIDATYTDGILEIHVPKSKAARPAKITVKAGEAARTTG